LTVNEEIKAHIHAADMLNLPEVSRYLAEALEVGRDRRSCLRNAQRLLVGDFLGQELMTAIATTDLKLAVVRHG
jgi:hypothetical protein